MPVPLIMPPKVVLVLLLPVVRVALLPRVTLPPRAPPPAKEPMVWLKLFRSSVAPEVLAMETAEPVPKACPPAAAPARMVPALMVVLPV